MAASYPNSIRTFTTRTDMTDIVMAAHVNALQEEMSAVQNTLGTNPQDTSATVKARIATRLPLSGGTLTGPLSMGRQEIIQALMSDYSEKFYDGGDIAASTSIVLSNGNVQRFRTTGAVPVISLPLVPNNQGFHVTLYLEHAAGGSVGWGASIVWPEDIGAPEQITTVGSVGEFSFFTFTGGNRWMGHHVATFPA